MKTIIINIILLILFLNTFSQDTILSGGLINNLNINTNIQYEKFQSFKAIVENLKTSKRINTYKISFNIGNIRVLYKSIDSMIYPNAVVTDHLNSYLFINDNAYCLDTITIFNLNQDDSFDKGINSKLDFGTERESEYNRFYQCFNLTDYKIYTFRIPMDNCNGTGCWNEYSFLIFVNEKSIKLKVLKHFSYQEPTPFDWNEKSFFINKTTNTLQTWYFETKKAWNELPKEGSIYKILINYDFIKSKKLFYIKSITDDGFDFNSKYILKHW